MRSIDLNSQHGANEAFEYRDGILFWRYREDCPASWNTKFAGKAAGSNKKGYVKIKQGGKFYVRSRVVWIYHFGEIPEGLQIDHINRIPSDDRLENLRLATGSENCWNAMSRGSISGCRGVVKDPRRERYQAKITAHGVTHHLGMFPSISEAKSAYKEAAKRLHGSFSTLAGDVDSV